MLDYEQIQPVRPGLPPLPDSDTLFRCQGGTVLRMRVTSRTTSGTLRDAAAQPGENEQIALKFQAAVCKDESGDVRLDGAGNHLLLAAEVHSVSAEALVADRVSFDGWLAERLDAAVRKAEQKAYVIERVLSRYRLTADVTPPAPTA